VVPYVRDTKPIILIHRMRMIPSISMLVSCILLQLVTLKIIVANASQEVSMGTTILAVRYRDGVVVGADTRTSVGGYVSNRYAMKIDFVLESKRDVFAIPPTDIQYQSSLYKAPPPPKTSTTTTPSSTCSVCRSGSAADTQNLVDTVRHQLLARKILHSSHSSVSHVAHLLRQHVVGGDNNPMASLICAGYDHVLERGVVYSIDLGGTLVEHKGWTSSGSGSTYVLGFMDANFPKVEGMVEDGGGEVNGDSSLWSEDEAVEFVAKAIELAMDRDGSSGGFVRMFVIDRDGKRAIVRIPKKALSSEGSSRSDGSGKSLTNFALPKR